MVKSIGIWDIKSTTGFEIIANISLNQMELNMKSWSLFKAENQLKLLVKKGNFKDRVANTNNDSSNYTFKSNFDPEHSTRLTEEEILVILLHYKDPSEARTTHNKNPTCPNMKCSYIKSLETLQIHLFSQETLSDKIIVSYMPKGGISCQFWTIRHDLFIPLIWSVVILKDYCLAMIEGRMGKGRKHFLLVEAGDE